MEISRDKIEAPLLLVNDSCRTSLMLITGFVAKLRPARRIDQAVSGD